MNERSSNKRRGGRPRGEVAKPPPGAEIQPDHKGREPQSPEKERRPTEEKLLRISGLTAVTALFRQHPERAIRLYYAETMKHEAGPLCARMAEMRRIYRLVADEELVRIAGTVHHGGIVLAAQARPLQPLDTDAAERWAQHGEPLIVLDGVGNPHNLGAIARTLAFFGIPRILLSAHQAQAGLSDAAYRVAEGGLEYLEILETPNLPQALKELRDSYRVVGTALRGGRAFGALGHDPRPICLVLGNEEEGLPQATLRACEALLTIRGSGAVQSLNVSATAAILVTEIMRSRPRHKQPETTAARRPRPKRKP